jgi:hypothetical protein
MRRKGGQEPMPDMLVKLYELPDAAPLIKALNDHGIVIRAAMPYEKHLVTEWVRNTFSRAWESECDVEFSNHHRGIIAGDLSGSTKGG